MQEEYKRLAKYYDIFYQSKNYKNESEFIIKLFKKYNVKSVLDVGCGTGNHIFILEKAGFECTGLDLNSEMVNIAKEKVKSPIYQADVCNFKLEKKFDAIICMFATFNHLTTKDAANKALSFFYQHLNNEGVLIIDLHNPQNSGNKIDEFKKMKRLMSWSYDKISKIEKTKITFVVPEGIIEDEHILRIYSIEEIKELIKNAGFKDINSYEDYTFKPTKESSKNIEIVGIQNQLKGSSKTK